MVLPSSPIKGSMSYDWKNKQTVSQTELTTLYNIYRYIDTHAPYIYPLHHL